VSHAPCIPWPRGATSRQLNDAVKGYLGTGGDFDPFLDLPHLKVFVARPEYLLAMKCASMRLGEEFHDLDDVRYLLRSLNVTTAEEAWAIVTRYFDERQLRPKTRLALDELLGTHSGLSHAPSAPAGLAASAPPGPGGCHGPGSVWGCR